jgi:hypothetical protein
LSDTLAIFISFSFLFSSPYFSDTAFCQNSEKTGCPFPEGTCWTLLVKAQHVFLEHPKLLPLSDTVAIFI